MGRDRDAVYSHPSRLKVVGQGAPAIQSTTGVRQGNPIGPLLFPLALQQFLKASRLLPQPVQLPHLPSLPLPARCTTLRTGTPQHTGRPTPSHPDSPKGPAHHADPRPAGYQRLKQPQNPPPTALALHKAASALASLGIPHPNAKPSHPLLLRIPALRVLSGKAAALGVERLWFAARLTLTDNWRSMLRARPMQLLQMKLNVHLLNDRALLETLGAHLLQEDELFDSIFDDLQQFEEAERAEQATKSELGQPAGCVRALQRGGQHGRPSSPRSQA